MRPGEWLIGAAITVLGALMVVFLVGLAADHWRSGRRAAAAFYAVLALACVLFGVGMALENSRPLL